MSKNRVAPFSIGDIMSKITPKDSEEDNDDEWHNFSNAGYSSANVDDEDNGNNSKDNENEEWFDGDDFELSLIHI